MKKQKLPQSFRPIMWSYHFDSLDQEKNKHAIIVNAINYGNLEHWRWVAHAYGKNNVKNILENAPIGEIRPQAQQLASVMFLIKHFNHAPRSTRRQTKKDFSLS